ncbi:M20/M25/M40 family metallo-hydrolase [Lutibacter sp. B1]|uniref:M20/M25/M40 family metallo-hydrolase n=1 Tax=Lutibacter sp. B1 TaxID=2725996 RepID=UPI001457383B|nr:M20/M25/M40 family metallo-hydrolase [Lutibacter sp. B1]NLP58817.1 M20/M25/M40 family metallo-hydrolase [Lutibacter sp. B1]
MKYPFLIISFLIIVSSCNQTPISKNEEPPINKTDSLAIKKIFDSALTKGECYQWLDTLCNTIGGRLSGSPEAEKAVKWGENLLTSLKFDKVWLQPVMVPHWVRGKKEEAYFTSNGTTYNVPICALGGSISTSKNGVKGEVIEVKSLEEAEKLGEQLKGKIVFFNRPFDDTLIETFRAYGGCVDQRYSGAKVTGKFGALGVIVRSMTHNIDDFPHTGAMSYGEIPENEKVPTAAISTKAANLLSETLKTNPTLEFFFKQNCETLPDAPSFNVIGEITGSEFPEKYITVGGHLDSWDLADGAHDDGTGIVQSIEVLRLLKLNGIKPKHSIRVVLFMNEENGLRGGKKYAEEAKNNNEIHIAALESDAGGHTPRGFSFDSNSENYNLFMSWKPLLAPYGLHEIDKGYGGADIGPLKSETISLFGYKPDSQRYFDYHHAATDTFDKVNKRELELGAASMTSLIYLLDTYLN